MDTNNMRCAKQNPQTTTICTLPKSLCSKVRSVTSAQTFKAFLISESTSLLVNRLVEGYLEILQVSSFVFHLEPEDDSDISDIGVKLYLEEQFSIQYLRNIDVLQPFAMYIFQVGLLANGGHISGIARKLETMKCQCE